MGTSPRTDFSLFSQSESVKTALAFFFLVCHSSLFAQCAPDEVPAISPFTSHSECIRRWKKDRVLIVVEKDCQPCQKMLSGLSKKKKLFGSYQFEALLIENDPQECLKQVLLVQKFERVNPVGCSTKENLSNLWNLNSTPTLFWIENQVQKTQTGVF